MLAFSDHIVTAATTSEYPSTVRPVRWVRKRASLGPLLRAQEAAAQLEATGVLVGFITLVA
jgi:hypothetical protein